MDPHIVMGEITPAASDFCNLRLTSGLNFNASPDRVAIGPRTLQAHCHPMIPSSTLVMVEAGAVIQIDHQYVNVPVIIEVTERSAARRFRNQQIGGFASNFLKLTVTGIAIELF